MHSLQQESAQILPLLIAFVLSLSPLLPPFPPTHKTLLAHFFLTVRTMIRDHAGPPYRNRSSLPANHRSFSQPHHHWRRYRPPGPPPFSPAHRRPNFVIELCSQFDSRNSYNRHEIVSLMGKFKSSPNDFFIFEKGVVAGRFFYQQWSDALQTVVHLWESRLNGALSFTPKLVQNVIVASDTEELNSQLRVLFSNRVLGFMEGDSVKKWEHKLGTVSSEIMKIDALLKKLKRLGLHRELLKKKEWYAREKDLIERRINEFKSAMECILDYLNGKIFESSDVRVLRLGGDFNWSKIYYLMLRECRRLDDGLPIYSARKDILSQIQCQQVMVLMGETGSGKSTQLVQFLTDSGVAANKSIVCTQPRKLAALSLANRVQEESCGCLEDNSVVCSSSYTSLCDSSKVIYMTDHCLLQYYMTDKSFSKISCIIVDEAHERSLNTDLLLAFIKDLLDRRLDLRVIIMSATADARQLSKYFFNCGTFHVVGRNFPVDIRYIPFISTTPFDSGFIAPYVSEVVKRVHEIHKTEEEGTILAFLTSQMEVEWACGQFQAPSTISLPLHGKLSHEEQYRVYLSYPGKRKVIFSTNLAETSLTIPGVKYVVDSGMVKESRFDPGTGMNVLKVCRISQSSANQRAGRAGRTEAGKCFRLYQENDFKSMSSHQEPEIRRVHLGVAVLKILALGIKNIEEFDFIDAPCTSSIKTAIGNLVQLGAIFMKNGVHELTKDGRNLVKLGIEPRLGTIILKCFEKSLGKEGLVLAAVMANSSSIFCRVGSDGDKQKSDRLKVQFCHRNGDLFTLLSAYKKWESVDHDKRNQWCWDNSINAKSMRRCQETVQEMAICLKQELNITIRTNDWLWTPELDTENDKILKNIILSALPENVAMYSGNDHLGYEVASTGTHVQLHPSCSLRIFGERPNWVVFDEILAISSQYLVCVTAIDFESLHRLCPPPSFDFLQMNSRKLQMKILTGYGSILLKRFCGKSNSGLKHLISHIKDAINDDKIELEVSIDRNEVHLFASTQHMEKVTDFVNDALEREEKWLQNECLEKWLYPARRASPPVALFGSGAEIKHLELKKKCLTVNVYHSSPNDVDEKELLSFLERKACGEICTVHRFGGVGQDSEKNDKWGRVTFLNSNAAEKALEDLSQIDFKGVKMTIKPSRNTYGCESKFLSFPSVKAKVSWPRRRSKGYAFVKCETRDDVLAMIRDFSNVLIQGKSIICSESMKFLDNVMLHGLDVEVSEAELFEALRNATNRKILDLHMPRGKAVENPPINACEEALLRKIRPFMPISKNEYVRVHVFPPESMDYLMKAEISFDGSLHLEAARALEQIEGIVLPGFESWQKIKCQQQFHTSVSCPAPVYMVIKDQLHSLLKNLRQRKGTECFLDRNENGSFRVKISAKATKIMADARRPLEQLMNGKAIIDPRLTSSILQLLFSRDGFVLQKSVQRETGTYFLFDRQSQSLRVFGPLNKLDLAQEKLVKTLVELYENKQLDVSLRGGENPPDLMKKVVEKFGPDLQGLKERFPGSEFSLNTRLHAITIHGGKELKPKVEETIREIIETNESQSQSVKSQTPACPICLCNVDDGYRLESCRHEFCRQCLIEQCESAIKSHDSFPIRCAGDGCRKMILITDLKSLLPPEKLDELFRASLGAFVASSGGKFRFCPSPDCPSVYQAGEPEPFICGACAVETCTFCHLEYHPFLSCEKYREFKRDPDSSLKEWIKGKQDVKHCPICGFTIEKIDGCNHIECRCGRHICWVCVESFTTSDECYAHLRSIHHAII